MAAVFVLASFRKSQQTIAPQAWPDAEMFIVLRMAVETPPDGLGSSGASVCESAVITRVVSRAAVETQARLRVAGDSGRQLPTPGLSTAGR
jgi:hypothetical protein